MNLTARIGTYRGIELRINPLFYGVLALGALTWAQFGAAGVFWGVVSTALAFGSVLLHEMGHARVAQHFGIQSKDITLYPFGGVCNLEKKPATAFQEGLIAVAGPAVNVVIATVMFAFFASVFGLEWIEATWRSAADGPSLSVVLVILMFTNVVVAVFNMIPAFPLDGGRLFRAVLWGWLGHERGTKIAKYVAYVLGTLGVGYGLATRTYMLVVISVLVLAAAKVEPTLENDQSATG